MAESTSKVNLNPEYQVGEGKRERKSIQVYTGLANIFQQIFQKVKNILIHFSLNFSDRVSLMFLIGKIKLNRKNLGCFIK